MAELRWSDWQDRHMPDEVLSAREQKLAAIIAGQKVRAARQPEED